MLRHLCDICCHNSERIQPGTSGIFVVTVEPIEVEKMLASGKIVGFVPTRDYDKARAFYENQLEFEFVSLDQYALVMNAGGHMIRITKVPNFAPLQGTILGWEVQDIKAVAAWLTNRGVALEKYPFVQDRELGIWTTPTGDKVAWFKDPDGNILSLSQHS